MFIRCKIVIEKKDELFYIQCIFLLFIKLQINIIKQII